MTDHEFSTEPSSEYDELTHLFRRAARLMLRGRGLHGPMHPAQGRALSLLLKRGSMSQRLLMEEMGVRAGSLSELLAKLERHALIERTRDDQDKRGFIITLTAHGEAFIAEHAMREKEMSEALFASLSEEEREQLRVLLIKLTDAWERELGDPDMHAARGHRGHGAMPHGHGRHGHMRHEHREQCHGDHGPCNGMRERPGGRHSGERPDGERLGDERRAPGGHVDPRDDNQAGGSMGRGRRGR